MKEFLEFLGEERIVLGSLGILLGCFGGSVMFAIIRALP